MHAPLTPAPVMTTAELKQAEFWVFDLDNTLYPASCNLFSQIEKKMTQFVADLLKLERDEAYKVQKGYFQEFGTTLRGLMSNHNVEPQAYMDFVHDIDLSAIAPHPELDEALEGLLGQKLIFTNGSTGHASSVLDKLGIRHHFEFIHDIADADYIPKPDPKVYIELVERYGLNPSKTVMVEDMARNLKPAANLGMTCIWVHTDNDWGQDSSDGEHVHHQIKSMAELITYITN